MEEILRIIEYKESNSNQFKRYVDIGACEKHYDFLPLFKEDEMVYNEWYLDFVNLSIGEQILTLHYYLMNYNTKGFVPNVLKDKIAENIDYLNNFNQKWFDPDVPFFQELDLNWVGIEEQITSTKENDDGIRTEIEFEDGGVIKFLDDDDYIKSFFVLEDHYPEIEIETEKIIEKLK
jgi:hypothetical protein